VFDSLLWSLTVDFSLSENELYKVNLFFIGYYHAVSHLRPYFLSLGDTSNATYQTQRDMHNLPETPNTAINQWPHNKPIDHHHHLNDTHSLSLSPNKHRCSFSKQINNKRGTHKDS